MASKNTETGQNPLIYEMGSLLNLLGLCLWLFLAIHSSKNVASQVNPDPRFTVEGRVSINGTASIGKIDDDFICATLDWWPPDNVTMGLVVGALLLSSIWLVCFLALFFFLLLLIFLCFFFLFLELVLVGLLKSVKFFLFYYDVFRISFALGIFQIYIFEISSKRNTFFLDEHCKRCL